MRKINLLDGCFPHLSASNLGGENAGLPPKYFSWDRTASAEDGPVFLTDLHITRANTFRSSQKKIAWLVEPPSLSATHYEAAQALVNEFDYILTFDRELLTSEKWLFYPFGGSWISAENWGLGEKTKDVSLIATDKRRAVGHRMRHEAAALFSGVIDIFGRGYHPVESKVLALKPYRYSVVVESCRLADYFSEKLIDVISQGTVPIYWGAPGIGRFFDMDGIIAFSEVAELSTILSSVVSPGDYEARRKAIEKNMQIARRYITAEDWLWEEYPFLFD